MPFTRTAISLRSIATGEGHVGRKMNEMSVDWTETLSKALGLQRYDQDWGICNADPTRVIEFIEFYNQHIPENPWELEALAELILASADDGCSDGTFSESIKSIVRCFVKDRQKEFPHQWAYWSKLDSREFPVVELLVTDSDGQQDS